MSAPETPAPQLPDNDDRRGTISIAPLISSRTLEPMVNIRIGDVFRSLDPNDAREIAHQLLAAAHAAEQDAFVLDWLGRLLEVDRRDPRAYAVLAEFRDYKTARLRAHPPPEVDPDAPADWTRKDDA